MNDLEQTVAEINGNFPVPGKDNISQGFRDNITKIKAAIVTGKQIGRAHV